MSTKKVLTVGEWTDALRSGKYQQGQNTLQTVTGRMCCLGVLCDLVDSDKWGMIEGTPYWDGAYGALPPDTLTNQLNKLFYITDEFTGDHESVASYNDQGRSFEDIANIIEKQYPRTREIVWSEDGTSMRLAALEAMIADLGDLAPKPVVASFRRIKALASVRDLTDGEERTLARFALDLNTVFRLRCEDPTDNTDNTEDK